MLQHVLQDLDALPFLRQANEVLQWLVVHSFSMGQVEGITSFLPPCCKIENCGAQLASQEKRRVRVRLPHHDRRRTGTLLELLAGPYMNARNRCDRSFLRHNAQQHIVDSALVAMPSREGSQLQRSR